MMASTLSVVTGLMCTVMCSGILIDNPHHFSTPDYLKSCRATCTTDAQEATKCSVPLPRCYAAHHLNGQAITVDGRLDEDAWTTVPWTENFVDIRGLKFPAPPVETKVKIRWDDKFVYVGAYMQEPHVWATYTQKDSRVYQENAFEATVRYFFNTHCMSEPGGIIAFHCLNRYKEIEINALGTTWDLIMSRAYLDGGDWKDWEGISQKAAYTDGAVNNATVTATFWSAEISFPFSKLCENTSRPPGPATEGEMWFMELARPRYTLEALPNSTYAKKPGSDASWFAWSPTGAINLHLPSKWGLLFFTKVSPSITPSLDTDRWITYQALFDIFDALVAFKAQKGAYVDNLTQLNLPPYITADNCFLSVGVSLTGTDGFIVTVVSKNEPGVKGHINQNRHVVFSKA